MAAYSWRGDYLDVGTALRYHCKILYWKSCELQDQVSDIADHSAFDDCPHECHWQLNHWYLYCYGELGVEQLKVECYSSNPLVSVLALAQQVWNIGIKNKIQVFVTLKKRDLVISFSSNYVSVTGLEIFHKEIIISARGFLFFFFLQKIRDSTNQKIQRSNQFPFLFISNVVKSLKGVDRIVVVSRWIAHQGDKEMTWHVSRLFGLSLPEQQWRMEDWQTPVTSK